MKLFSSIAGFFRARYIGLVEFLVTSIMLVVNRLMRHLILLKGKNPDQAAELAQQPAAPVSLEEKYAHYDPARAEQTIQRFHMATRTNVMNDREWVGDISRHPVILSRTQVNKIPQDGPHPSDELTEAELTELSNATGAAKEWIDIMQSSASKAEDK